MKGIKNNKTVGFIGAGNLGRHAIEKLADEYSLLVHDPFEDQRIINLGVKYTDLNYNGMNDKQLEKLTGKYTYNPFDNSVIIIEF